ncbi:MAG: hypothetical protein NTW08_06785 [Gammaproteobacteria bacterium]|nr:hypothetical protein [Gammaproteobacteria bacterium]
MPKQSSNSFSPITVELALFTLTAAGIGFAIRKGGVIPTNEHLWWQNGTQVFMSFMKSFSDAYKVHRDQEHQKESELYAQMQTLYAAGQQAMRRGEYRSSADCFKRTAQMFKGYYKEVVSELLTDLYAQCIYDQARSLYQLREYQEARVLIEDLFKENLNLNAATIKIELHNLNGLLCFIQYQTVLFEQKEPEHTLLEKAKEQLQQSYALNQEQDDVYLMIHYLHGNMALLVKRQPFEILAPLQKDDVKLRLCFQQDSLFYPFIYFMIADAHADQKQWREAIYLYEQYLAHVPSGTSPHALFDQFITRFHCLVAYRQYLAMLSDDNAQYDLLDNVKVSEPKAQEGEEKKQAAPQQLIQLICQSHSKVDLKKRATAMALRAKSFLEDRIPGPLPPGYERAYTSLAHVAQQVVDPETYKRFTSPVQPVARSSASLWSERFFAHVPPEVSGITIPGAQICNAS